MKSNQLIAVSLLGLVPRTMAVPVLAEFAHAPAPAIRDAIDSTPAGGVVKFSDTHNQYMGSQKELVRLRAQVTPPDTPPIPFTFVGPKDDQVESSHIEDNTVPAEYQSPPPKQVNQKLIQGGSKSLPQRNLIAVGGRGGGGGEHGGGGGAPGGTVGSAGYIPYGGSVGGNRAGHHSAADDTPFSYLLSLFGLWAAWAVNRT